VTVSHFTTRPLPGPSYTTSVDAAFRCDVVAELAGRGGLGQEIAEQVEPKGVNPPRPVGRTPANPSCVLLQGLLYSAGLGL
jgi:hypothetical protein